MSPVLQHRRLRVAGTPRSLTPRCLATCGLVSVTAARASGCVEKDITCVSNNNHYHHYSHNNTNTTTTQQHHNNHNNNSTTTTNNNTPPTTHNQQPTQPTQPTTNNQQPSVAILAQRVYTQVCYPIRPQWLRSRQGPGAVYKYWAWGASCLRDARLGGCASATDVRRFVAVVQIIPQECAQNRAPVLRR